MKTLFKILSMLTTMNAARKGRLHQNLANKAAHRQTRRLTNRLWRK